MDNEGSWKSDLLRLGLLTGLCLVLGLHQIRQTILISRDGVFYIGQAQQVAADWTGVARRYPAGYPFLLWAAHEAALRVVGSDSALLWAHSSQGVTLVCRALALIPLYFLGKLLVGGRHSFWALLILIVLPYPARFGTDVLREWPHLLFLSLGFWLLLWALRGRRWWMLALVGLVAGLGYTIRPECALLVLYAGLGLAFLARQPPSGDLALPSGSLGSGPSEELSSRVAKPPRDRCPDESESHPRGATPKPRLSVSLAAGKARSSKFGRATHAVSLLGAQCRDWRFPGFLLAAGFLVPVVPYVYATGVLVPHQLQPVTGNALPVISAIGPRGACDGVLAFEVAPGEVLELPVRATDPDGDRLRFSLVGVPVGTGPVYEFHAPSQGRRFWTASELEKHFLLTTYPRDVWSYEGIAFYAYTQADARPGLQGVHRFWSQQRERHFYTSREQEIQAIGPRAGDEAWRYEGVVFYAWAGDDHPPDVTPVYRSGSEEQGYSWTVPRKRGHSPFPAPLPGPIGSMSQPAAVPQAPPGTAAVGANHDAPPQEGQSGEGRSQEVPPAGGTAVWYVHLGGEPPAGATIEDGVFRWRPGPGQTGEHQINLIVSDGDLEACQVIKIHVGPRLEDRGQKTDDGGHRTKDGGQAAEDGAVLRPQHAGLERLPEAVNDLFASVAENLMVVFLVPWLLGLYYRLRYPVERLERVLVVDLLIVNVALILSRHLAFGGGGEDRRYSLALIALTIFYVPIGLEQLAQGLRQWKSPVRPSWPWFHILVLIGLAVCAPKLLMSGRADKTGYRAAAAWLRQNTRAEDVVAVPDSRIPFYAERRGLLYTDYPDSRRADYVVLIGRDGKVPVPPEWRREYSTAIRRDHPGSVVLYRTGRGTP